MRLLRILLATLLFVFVLPASASVAVWIMQDRPSGWRNADWNASGLLPPAASENQAVIHVLAARTGGLKGALSVHSWLVIKPEGASGYDRYDKVGWGAPVRKNAYPADGRWYSNNPFVVATLRGAEAKKLIPLVERAIAEYPFARNGDYRIWPGPNSNSFVAHVLRQVPQLGATLPPNAVARDFLPGNAIFSADSDLADFHVNLFGLAGFAVGMRSGVELHFLGLVAGLDILRPALKIPGFGRVGL